MEIDYIFCYPKRIGYWNYKMNEKIHGIKSEELYPFVKQYISENEYANANEYINRNIAFIIDCNGKILQKLRKSMDTQSYHHGNLTKSLISSMDNYCKQPKSTFEDMFKTYSQTPVEPNPPSPRKDLWSL